MLNLFSLLSATKGATVAAAVVLGAATLTVGVTSPEVQDTVSQVAQTVAQNLGVEASPDADEATGHCGQPAVVAQRNAADKLLRAAFQTDHKKLTDLRGKDADNGAIKTADDQLKGILTKALDDVGALTLGRNGHNETTGTPPDTTCTTTTPDADEPESAGKPEQEGRVTVAQRTTLDGAIQAIVDKAIADMDAAVAAAQTAAGPATSEHGSSNDHSGSNAGGNNPGGHPGGKPTGTPKH